MEFVLIYFDSRGVNALSLFGCVLVDSVRVSRGWGIYIAGRRCSDHKEVKWIDLHGSSPSRSLSRSASAHLQKPRQDWEMTRRSDDGLHRSKPRLLAELWLLCLKAVWGLSRSQVTSLYQHCEHARARETTQAHSAGLVRWACPLSWAKKTHHRHPPILVDGGVTVSVHAKRPTMSFGFGWSRLLIFSKSASNQASFANAAVIDVINCGARGYGGQRYLMQTQQPEQKSNEHTSNATHINTPTICQCIVLCHWHPIHHLLSAPTVQIRWLTQDPDCIND